MVRGGAGPVERTRSGLMARDAMVVAGGWGVGGGGHVLVLRYNCEEAGVRSGHEPRCRLVPQLEAGRGAFAGPHAWCTQPWHAKGTRVGRNERRRSRRWVVCARRWARAGTGQILPPNI